MRPELRDKFGARVRFDEPMSKHTTFRVGGPADALVDVETADELRFALDLARRKGVEVRLLGGGSNVLVRDAGVRGIVVRLAGDFHGVGFDDKTNTLCAGAGAPLSAICAEAVKRGFNNFCWTAGIPGTVGGAILGNAGAWGHDVGEFAESITVMTRAGEKRVLAKGDLRFEYRSASLSGPGLILLNATLRLAKLDAPETDAKELMRDYVERKRRTQPLEHPSAGSVFKNPAPDKPAGLLIDRAGCKGLRVEGACVSPKHANFIVNDRRACATDVTQLIDLVRARVKESAGVSLDLEIQVW